MNIHKTRGKRIFEIKWHKWYSLAWPSKGQWTISKILSSTVYSIFIEQNIFFPASCFAYTISEPKFAVWYENYFISCNYSKSKLDFRSHGQRSLSFRFKHYSCWDSYRNHSFIQSSFSRKQLPMQSYRFTTMPCSSYHWSRLFNNTQ